MIFFFLLYLLNTDISYTVSPTATHRPVVVHGIWHTEGISCLKVVNEVLKQDIYLISSK